MDHFSYSGGEYRAEEVALSRIAEAVGTPFYCYSSATMVRHYRMLAEALEGVPAGEAVAAPREATAAGRGPEATAPREAEAGEARPEPRQSPNLESRWPRGCARLVKLSIWSNRSAINNVNA